MCSLPASPSIATKKMASTILPLAPVKMTGDLSTNWASFQAESEDYLLVTGLHEKAADVQAATLRRLMGNDCRHSYRHNLGLTQVQQEDIAIWWCSNDTLRLLRISHSKGMSCL